MINRLTYEVRLKPLHKNSRSKTHKKWRWDVTYYATTDPEYPGVETGRQHLGNAWGYERFKFQAKNKIANNILDNPYKSSFEEI